MENDVMQIIVYAGNARSLAMQSIRTSKQGKMSEAKEMLQEAENNLKEAHHVHAKILSSSAEDPSSFELNLFVVHGEDHLMSAVTTIDLAKEFMDIHEELHQLKEAILYTKEGKVG